MRALQGLQHVCAHQDCNCPPVLSRAGRIGAGRNRGIATPRHGYEALRAYAFRNQPVTHGLSPGLRQEHLLVLASLAVVGMALDERRDITADGHKASLRLQNGTGPNPKLCAARAEKHSITGIEQELLLDRRRHVRAAALGKNERGVHGPGSLLVLGSWRRAWLVDHGPGIDFDGPAIVTAAVKGGQVAARLGGERTARRLRNDLLEKMLRFAGTSGVKGFDGLLEKGIGRFRGPWRREIEVRQEP